MVFLDACRGNQWPPPVTKGRLIRPLAGKLKQRQKSVQEVLKEMKQDLLKNSHVQYPEIQDSDCRQPVYLKGTNTA